MRHSRSIALSQGSLQRISTVSSASSVKLSGPLVQNMSRTRCTLLLWWRKGLSKHGVDNTSVSGAVPVSVSVSVDMSLPVCLSAGAPAGAATGQ